MERIRKPFQGLWNIIRFNWHFFVISLALLISLFLLANYLGGTIGFYIQILCLLIFIPTFVSLVVSFYVYDLSDLYEFKWLKEVNAEKAEKIVNIHAGFDETSLLLQKKMPGAALSVFDFYDPEKHTEVSIKRARKAYPPFPDTLKIKTTSIPLPDKTADLVFVILSAHEIRKTEERDAFFIELKRILKSDGKIVITEHLRDWPNFVAYNIGFFHFMSKKTWYSTFEKANLHLSKSIKNTPFITTFILEKNGTAS